MAKCDWCKDGSREPPARGKFDEIYKWLTVEGKVTVMPSAGENFTTFDAEADTVNRSPLVRPGTRVVKVWNPETGYVAYLYPCCWGYDQNHSGVRISWYHRELENRWTVRQSS